jgi:hypothetical protein
MNNFPRAPEYTMWAISKFLRSVSSPTSPVTTTPAIMYVVDNGEQLIAGVNNTPSCEYLLKNFVKIRNGPHSILRILRDQGETDS